MGFLILPDSNANHDNSGSTINLNARHLLEATQMQPGGFEGCRAAGREDSSLKLPPSPGLRATLHSTSIRHHIIPRGQNTIRRSPLQSDFCHRRLPASSRAYAMRKQNGSARTGFVARGISPHPSISVWPVCCKEIHRARKTCGRRRQPQHTGRLIRVQTH